MFHAGDASPPKNLETEIFSQVDFANRFIIDDFLRLAEGQDRSLVDDVGMIAYAQSLTHIVIGNEHSNATIFQEFDDFLNIDYRDGINARKWLIEQNEPGLDGERSRDFDPAAFAAGEADRRTVAQMRNMQLIHQ